MNKASIKIIEELEIIRKKNGGMIDPKKVVDFARNEKTALHRRFEWDDSVAAEEYRIWQARAIIRICVVVDEVTKEQTRIYVSLDDDRGEEGYRSLVEVLQDDDLKEKMLSSALRDLEYFNSKYNTLKNISKVKPIFKAIKIVLGERTQ